MALAEREHARAKTANDATARLEKEVQKKAASVAKIGERLNHLAKESVPKGAAQPRAISIDQVLAVLGEIDKLAEKAPARAREVLAGVIEPVILTPSADGYEASLTLKNETAAIAGGRSTLLLDGCGGRI